MKKLLALIMALAMVFCLCACGNDDTKTGNTDTPVQSSQTETSSEEESTPKFEVTVKDQNGNPVKGATVQVCNEGNCFPGITNDDGIATFNIEITDEHYLTVPGVPEGYETKEDKTYLEDGITEYTVEITAKEEA